MDMNAYPRPTPHNMNPSWGRPRQETQSFGPPQSTQQGVRHPFQQNLHMPRPVQQNLYSTDSQHITMQSGPNLVGSLTVKTHEIENTEFHRSLLPNNSRGSAPKEPQIPIAKKLLKQLHFLLRQLSNERDLLQQKLGSSKMEWQNECQKIQHTKGQVTEILEKFTHDYIKDVGKRIDRRNKMRLRKRKQAERRHQEERIAKNERVKMQKELDKLIATEMKEKEKKKQDAELQKEIDSTLLEVRQKKREMSQKHSLYRALRKLRLVREGTMPNSASRQDDENFDRSMIKLEDFVRQRSIMYREEEKTMQVMLEGERSEMKAQEDERALRKKAKAEAAKLKLQTEILFGEETLEKNASEQSLISGFYNQANENLQCFIDVRRQWDAFIIEDHPDASRIPLNWVSPALPSSDMWATTLNT